MIGFLFADAIAILLFHSVVRHRYLMFINVVIKNDRAHNLLLPTLYLSRDIY